MIIMVIGKMIELLSLKIKIFLVKLWEIIWMKQLKILIKTNIGVLQKRK